MFKSFYCWQSWSIVAFVSFLFSACCFFQRPQDGGVIGQVVGREVVFQRLLSFNIPDRMSLGSLLESSEYSVVIYVDSSSCEDCGITFALNTRGFELELKQKQREDIPFIYIFNTQDVWTLQSRLREMGFHHYYFVDFENTFLEKNEIPANKLFHTFLLKNNKIHLIGNPSTNQKVRKLYNKILRVSTRS